MKSIKAYIIKNKVSIVKIITIFLALISLMNIYITLKINVTSNDECLWLGKKVSADSVAYFFTNVKVDGVAWQAGIRDGDQLIKINDYVVRNDQVAQSVLNLVDEGKYAYYLVKKPDGTFVQTKVKIKKLIAFGILTFVISALFWLIIGFLVFMAKPDGKQQKLFFLVGVLFVFSSFFNLFPQTANLFEFISEHLILSLIIYTLASIGVSALPFAFLYFIWIFFKPLKIAQKKWIKVLFIIFSCLAFIYSMSLLPDMYKMSPDFFMESRKYQNFMNLINAITNSIAGITIIFIYFKEKDKQARKPILLIILSFALAFAIQIYISTIAPVLADTIFNSPEYYAPIILLILVPIIFAYAIFKYHLLDMSAVVMNTVFYSVATATVVAIYFLSVYGLGHSLSNLFGVKSQGIIAIILFTIFAIRFQSTKDKALKIITQKFYPEQFAYQNVLIKFSNEIPSVVGKENILNLTLKTFVDSLRIKKFAILLSDSKSNRLRLIKQFGFTNRNCELNLTSIQKYFEEKQLISAYPEISREDFEKLFGEKAQMLIEEEIYTIIPLIVKSKVVGVLLFGLKYSGSKFSGKDIELLYAAANQLAISIENARLYQSVVEKQKIEHDLELARNIQRNLLPSCTPNLNGLDICGEMIPAMQVGGDYYDLIPIDNKRIFIAVADVSGKGLSASLYMTKLQTIIKLYCKDESSPKEILIETNKLIYESFEPGDFITMTLALFDTEKMKIKFCRAGHLPVLLFDNNEAKFLRTRGIALGLDGGKLFDNNLEELEMDIRSGQVYSFFTDGITETMNDKNELFGDERLLKIFKNNSHLHSTEIMDKIDSEIQKFRNNAVQHDDMTMVIVKVK